ncbi:hypothetical protein [Alicyclobacillus herbarius]|nr:hypothetical protein [Alicyclobacillus herbarius]
MGYRIPKVKIALVREGSMASQVKQIRSAEDAYEILSPLSSGEK